MPAAARARNVPPMILSTTVGDRDWRSLRELLVELAGLGLADDSEYGVHRFGRRVLVEHDLGDTLERWSTVAEARAAFESARDDACLWQTGHPYDCACTQCEPAALWTVA